MSRRFSSHRLPGFHCAATIIGASATAISLALLTACASAEPEVSETTPSAGLRATVNDTEPRAEYPTGGAEGRLWTQDDGDRVCFMLDMEDQTLGIIAPYGWQADPTGTQLLDEQGTEVARAGTTLSIYGGQTSTEQDVALWGDCPDVDSLWLLMPDAPG